MYMYMADLIEALHKHVDLSYSMDLFVSMVAITRCSLAERNM